VRPNLEDKMAYNNVIGRADVAGIIPIETSMELLNGTAQQSFLMRMARRLRDMSVYEERLPVLSALATAYFPGGDTGLVQTSEVNWSDVTIIAEDLAVIVPVSKNVLSDAKIPIWDEVKKEMITAAGVAIDNAMLYGTNKPSTWPTALVTAMDSAGHDVSLADFDDLYGALLAENGVFGKVEEDGYGVNGVLANLTMKSAIRGTRDANGNPIFFSDPSGPGRYILDGAQCWFPETGITNSTQKMIAGAWQQLVYSMRADVAFEVHTEGVIQDANGKIVFNLLQQRMAAIMLTMRLGFAVPNTINRVNTDSATRYPFAYLKA
jgi:HK97 family phage major capsid protein